MVKKGFSLAEALVVMAIISIFFAAAGKIMTQRPKPQKIEYPHGYFECYLDGATLKQAAANEEVEKENIVASGGVCKFEPPKGVAFFNLNTYGQAFYSQYEPNVNKVINIRINNTPGAANFITFSNGQDQFDIPAEKDQSSSQFRNEREAAQGYFMGIHPKSKICNNGNYRTGVMVSW